MFSKKKTEEDAGLDPGRPKVGSAYDNMFPAGDNEFVSNMSKEQAFATVLAAAVYVDGKVKQVELQELKALMNRTRTMRGVDDAKRAEAYRAAVDSVDKPEKLWDSVSNACGRLRQLDKKSETAGIALSAYAHACDLVWADHDAPKPEMRLLRRLRDDLGLDPAEAQRVFDEIKIKNMI